MLSIKLVRFYNMNIGIGLLMLSVLMFKSTLAQNNEANTISKSYLRKNVVTEGKPQYIETGNKEVDTKNYEKAKEAYKSRFEKKTIAPAVINNNIVASENLKQHYKLFLNSNSNKKEEVYVAAISQYPRIENFRFVNKRRTIQLANGEGSIELFSANELLQLYGRSIRPQNIREGVQPVEVEFLLSDYGTLKEQLKK